MRLALWLAQAILTSIAGLYVESISSQRLLFFEDIFNLGVVNSIMQHPIRVIGAIGLLQIGVQSWVLYVSRDVKEKQACDNICKKVFDSVIRSNSKYTNSDFRVSLFKACIDRHYLGDDGKFKPKLKQATTLKMVGRFQTKSGNKQSAITFRSGQGCAGICYQTGLIVFRKINYFSELNPDLYYQDSWKQFKLPVHKAKKLNEKSPMYWCLPVKYFDSDELFGVLSIDCSNKSKFRGNALDVRVIESILAQSSVSFTLIKST